MAATLSEPELLLYRSNLLGSDLRITNFGGGNTSAKIDMTDPLTRRAGRGAVGQGLGRRPGHHQAGRLLDPVHGQAACAEEPLPRPRRSKTRWSAYLPHCTFNLNPRAASIDTPLHAYIARKHVDHMHPDAVHRDRRLQEQPSD